ncbi:phosphoenolpyruvate hydrolase family protein [Billgrantia gudaonensis]|uniref:Phosphoenolpyruvate hydrolase-like n=1 Tax=Billgrantia gudaonensis TaxID=376427 RepID=A0A1G8PP71_9GAMM|nr:phosphoenolpyruvate hydrolase family protein [Halomonas gudaonensis]SDI93640.1 Phosphoenolpyruvate hydrolase-like [Halomonas gudaonensis]
MPPSSRAEPGYLVASLEAVPNDADAPRLLSPVTARLPAPLSDLACSLPIGDANGELLEALHGDIAFPERGFAGVLAIDPFRLADDLLEMLSQRGCRRVANWPSTALLGGTLGESLAHSGLGYDEEMAFLARARQHGFHTMATIAREEQLSPALAAGPSQLLMAVPPEAAETQPDKARAGLLALMERVREAGYSPWLYEHDEVKALTASLHPWVEAVIRHPGMLERQG